MRNHPALLGLAAIAWLVARSCFAGTFDTAPEQAVLARLLPQQAQQFELGTLADGHGRERFRIAPANGHIRVDFGLDTPWVLEDENLDKIAQQKIQQNVQKLLAFTLSVEKHSGISSRLLWTESGEPLAEKLVASLQRLN